MLDLNLFSPYIEEKRENRIIYKYIFIGLTTFILISAVYTVWYHTRINSLEKNISIMNKTLSSDEIQLKLSELDRKKSQLNILNEYYEEVKNTNIQIEQIKNIDSSIIENINLSIPESVYFQFVTMSGDGIEIRGVSDNRISLAKFQEELKGKPQFSNVYIPSITNNAESNNYTFILIARIEGDINEIE